MTRAATAIVLLADCGGGKLSGSALPSPEYERPSVVAWQGRDEAGVPKQDPRSDANVIAGPQVPDADKASIPSPNLPDAGEKP